MSEITIDKIKEACEILTSKEVPTEGRVLYVWLYETDKHEGCEWISSDPIPQGYEDHPFILELRDAFD